jgi:hypothetical protein
MVAVIFYLVCVSVVIRLFLFLYISYGLEKGQMVDYFGYMNLVCFFADYMPYVL